MYLQYILKVELNAFADRGVVLEVDDNTADVVSARKMLPAFVNGEIPYLT